MAQKTVLRIKQVRKGRGLSLAETASRTKAGLLPQAVARAEREDQDPRASTVAEIADALRVPVCQVFKKSGHERRAPQRGRKR